MSKKQWYKIVSAITAIALLLSSLSGLTMVSAAEASSAIDFQAIVDAEEIEVSNVTSAEDIDAALAEIVLPEGYEYGGVYEFYKVDAFNGAVERGSIYAGAPDEEILVPGENGYITAITSLMDADGNETFYAINFIIEPEYEVYSFGRVSNHISDWTQQSDGSWKWTRGEGMDKVVMPDEITSLAQDWHSWQPLKCVVFSKNIETLGRCAYIQTEVASFPKDSKLTAVGDLAFMSGTNLKYIRLPDSVKSIGAEAFYGCKTLAQFHVPASLEETRQTVFAMDSLDANGTLDETRHNITEFIFPASVRYMSNSYWNGRGGPSWLGAGQDCTVTFLSREDVSDFPNAFYIPERPATGEKYTLRVWRGSSADENFATADGKKVYIDDMTLAEAIARSAKVVNKFKFDTFATLATVTAASEQLVEDIKAAYWGVEAIDVAIGGEWVLNGDKWVNTLVYENADYTVEMPLTALANYDFTATAESIPVNNDTTAESIVAGLVELQAAGAIPEGFEFAVTDFAKIRAFNGAIERGSTYAGAPTEDVVLVPGEKGYVVATITLSANGETKAYNINKVIEPTYEYYSFASCSTDADWNGNTYSGTKYEKIIVPDHVTELPTNWCSGGGVRCFVFGTGLKATPQNHWNGDLEVVSFKEGSQCERISALSFYAATKLKYIRMPDTVINLDGEAFRFNTAMEQLYLSKNLDRINNVVFFKVDEEGFHNLKEINIPASVTYIYANAFNGAGQDCTVNVWSKVRNYWNTNVFYNADYPAKGEKFTVRVWNQNGLSGTSDAFATAEGKKQHLDDMSFAEIVARATQAADAVKGNLYETKADIDAASDSILASITASYGGLTKVTANWKNADWTKLTVGWENAVVLTMGDKTDEIPVIVSSTFDLEAKLAEAGIVINNKTTKPTFLAQLKEKGIIGDDVKVEADVYVKEAFNGAIERGSTYEGAPTEDVVLVEPSVGYYAISIKVTSPAGISAVGTVSGKIEPHIEYYSFKSISKDSDFTVDANGVLTGYSGSAEKIVIPDSVVSNAQLDGAFKGKCLVIGKNMTTWNRSLWVAVDVVSFPEDGKLEVIGNCGFMWSTIKYVKLPDTLKHLGAESFRQIATLEQFYISNTINVIDADILAKPGENYAVRRIEIPASMKENYVGHSFVGGDQYSEITILSSGSFKADFAYHGTNGKNNVVKVFSNTSAASTINTAAGNKVYLDMMGAAEAAGRALEKADSIVGQYTENATSIKVKAEEIKTLITSAYWDAATVSAEWANAEWAQEGFNLVNTLIVTDGNAKFGIEIKVDTKSGYYSGNATILDSDEFIQNGSKQGLRFHFFYDSSAAEKIEIDGAEYTIKEYGVIMKHIADTYAGATAIADDAFVKGAEGVFTEIGDINTVITHTDNGVNEYTALIKNIPQGGKDYAFQYRGFITYVGADGADVTVYTESAYNSVQNIFNVVGSGADYSSMTDWFTGAALN